MSNYATSRFNHEQWTGSNAEDVATLLDTAVGETHTGTTVDEGGQLWVQYLSSMDRVVAADDYLVVGYGWFDQAVSPAKFAEFFVTA